jgi:hypothetical protein
MWCLPRAVHYLETREVDVRGIVTDTSSWRILRQRWMQFGIKFASKLPLLSIRWHKLVPRSVSIFNRLLRLSFCSDEVVFSMLSVFGKFILVWLRDAIFRNLGSIIYLTVTAEHVTTMDYMTLHSLLFSQCLLNLLASKNLNNYITFKRASSFPFLSLKL